MSGIMEKLFGQKPVGGMGQQTQPQSPLPTPANIPAGTGTGNPGTGGTAANGVVPTGANPTGSESGGTANQSPFAAFEKLWEPNVGPDGKPVAVTKEPLFNVDPKTVMEAAQRTDFKSVVTQEQMQKIAAGGPEAVAAMMDAMQAMSASVYANAAVAATKIAESGITKALAQAEQRLPSVIRNQSLNESLSAKNPALKDPAVQPIVELVKNQFAQKYPNATVSELQDMAEKYMIAAGSAFNPNANSASKQEQDQRAQIQKENDNWDIFFGQQPGSSGQNFNF